jgi:hypothetical protein
MELDEYPADTPSFQHNIFLARKPRAGTVGSSVSAVVLCNFTLTCLQGRSPQQPGPPLYTRLLIKIHQLLRAWIAVVSPRPLTLDQNAISGRTSKTLSSALSDIHTMREIGDHYHLRFVNIPRSGSSLS